MNAQKADADLILKNEDYSWAGISTTRSIGTLKDHL